MTAHGVRFAPGGIRKGAAGHDICFIHPKGNDEFPLGGEGVLIELVQAPPEVVAARASEPEACRASQTARGLAVCAQNASGKIARAGGSLGIRDNAGWRTAMTARTLYDKLWDEHVVHTEEDGTSVLYIDRHLVHEVTSPQAFEGLRLAGRKVWRTSSIVATADHNTPTTGWASGYDGIRDPISKQQVDHARRQHQAPSARRRTSRSWTSARASCTSSGRSRAPRCRA